MDNAGRQLHRNRELGKMEIDRQLKSKWGPRDFLKFLILRDFYFFLVITGKTLFILYYFTVSSHFFRCHR